MAKPDKIKSARVSVLGAARSGLSVAGLLKSQGAVVFVSDKKPKEESAQESRTLDNLGVDYEFGAHTDKIFDADFIVISPGVPSNSNLVHHAEKVGLKVYSEVEVASWFCRAPIVAITGSNGKTTTTTLIGKIFENAGWKTIVAGNIGFPFSDYVLDTDEKSVAVVEVSSFQLDHIDTFKPKAAVLLNITPDHLDRYENYEAYKNSKFRIFMNQTPHDFAIYNHDDEAVSKHCSKLDIIKLPFSVKGKISSGAFVESDEVFFVGEGKQDHLIGSGEIKIPGIHNLYNSIASALAARSLGVSPGVIADTLREFPGVEHRLEPVRELGGVRYINDSKATNVDAVWYALGSFESPIVLIAGGKDKGNDYSPLFDLVRKKVRAMVLIGQAAAKMQKEFSDKTKCVMASSMEDAVAKARGEAKPGHVVLLSPACASFDMFHDYEHRGREFKRLVMELE
ncbi:MAG TPA: UDP-N-acetylmuramoyl-L-alanine--D-glutamate ligase [Candidatus Acidoferrales bacterium]|nr:UDP-N-acetylmuramoyl-L-alanine--D-glutamate ligase [Candidatus Acidoferrales bacterium]